MVETDAKFGKASVKILNRFFQLLRRGLDNEGVAKISSFLVAAS